MTARQQIARLLPLAALVSLAIIGLRGQVAGPRWDGPLRAYGVIIGIALEVICGALLLITLYREYTARRKAEEALLAASAARASSGWITTGAEPVPVAATVPPPAAEDDTDDDRDVAASLRFLLKLALGTAMAAIAVTLVANLHLHLFTAKRKLPLLRVPKLGDGKKHHPVASSGPHFSFPVTPVLYGLLIVALLAALAFSIWWARRVADAAAQPDAMPGEADAGSEGLREAVTSGREAMTDTDDARAAIIACYAAMEASLAERGTMRGLAGTPDELLSRAVSGGLIRGGAARTLTRLFYEARFSTHPLEAAKRDAAARALDELAAELGDAPATARS